MGGEVPKSYYLGKEKPAPKNYMEQATVQRRSKLKMEYNVVRANAFLKYSLDDDDGTAAIHRGSFFFLMKRFFVLLDGNS